MFAYSQAEFEYLPYPICRIPNVLAPERYKELVDNYPPLDLFKYKPRLGEKYSLSERNNKAEFLRVLRETPCWGEFQDHIKRAAFIDTTLEFLRSRNVDLAIGPYTVRRYTGKRQASIASRLLRRAELSARFEFSAMSGQGGHIRPHTDEPKKLVTFVISMIRPGEWDEAWGGGTQTCLPKDRSLVYNMANRYLDFDDVEPIKTFEFAPNQCLLFVKTYDSWHQVAPINAPQGAGMRRTVTINIERLS